MRSGPARSPHPRGDEPLLYVDFRLYNAYSLPLWGQVRPCVVTAVCTVPVGRFFPFQKDFRYKKTVDVRFEEKQE